MPLDPLDADDSAACRIRKLFPEIGGVIKVPFAEYGDHMKAVRTKCDDGSWWSEFDCANQGVYFCPKRVYVAKKSSSCATDIDSVNNEHNTPPTVPSIGVMRTIGVGADVAVYREMDFRHGLILSDAFVIRLQLYIMSFENFTRATRATQTEASNRLATNMIKTRKTAGKKRRPTRTSQRFPATVRHVQGLPGWY
nr:hypothetical protein [Ferrovum sp.]